MRQFVKKGTVKVDLGSRYKDGSVRYNAVDFSTEHDEPHWGHREATVNWSALGDVSPAVARLYAQAILRAADLAEDTMRVDAVFTLPREEDPS